MRARAQQASKRHATRDSRTPTLHFCAMHERPSLAGWIPDRPRLSARRHGM
jgi:hypothetical protein